MWCDVMHTNWLSGKHFYVPPTALTAAAIYDIWGCRTRVSSESLVFFSKVAREAAATFDFKYTVMSYQQIIKALEAKINFHHTLGRTSSATSENHIHFNIVSLTKQLSHKLFSLLQFLHIVFIISYCANDYYVLIIPCNATLSTVIPAFIFDGWSSTQRLSIKLQNQLQNTSYT